MSTHTYSIVGAFYRPPAKALLAVLPIGTPLVLKADPYGSVVGGPHNDPTAIAVFMRTRDFPDRSAQAFDAEGAGYGYDTERLRGEADEYCVGYIPKALAATIPPPEADIEGEFTCSASGGPLVRFETAGA